MADNKEKDSSPRKEEKQEKQEKKGKKDEEKDNKSDAGSEDSDGPPAKRQEQLPDAVDFFLGQLLKGLETHNIIELHKLYEDTFNKLSDKYYKTARWPSFECITERVSSEPLFVIFYKELYYRHVYSHPNLLTFDDRKGSWENYCKLLDLIIDDLTNEDEVSVALPAQWIWDLLDEFVYHYQVYFNFRNKAVKLQKEKEIAVIKEHMEVFKTTTVLGYLHRLVKASRIEEYLAEPTNPNNLKGGAFTNECVRQIGYFALMQLLRMHSLLGDYHTAMDTIKCIDFQAEVPYFYKIPACHVTLYYYMGFAYMMMRRYVDAIRTFSDILVFLSKTSGVNNLSYQYDQMVKKQDQMYALLLMCLALCPQPLDESIEKTIRDKYLEKQARLSRGEELCFEELFSYACPKFVSGAPPDFEIGEAFNVQESHQRQQKLFLQEVQQQRFLPRISSYMKLYTAIKTSKLAQLCEMDEEALRDQLMCVMHKTHQRIRRDGPPLEGELRPCSEVEFYLDGDMVHINAQKTERPYSDVFLEHILKYQDLLKKMDIK